MTILFITTAILLLSFILGCNVICFSSYKKEEKIINTLKETQELSDVGRKEEADSLLWSAIANFIPNRGKYYIEACRQYAVLKFHFAMMADSKEKRDAILPTAKNYFEIADPWIFCSEEKYLISFLNDYAMTLFLLGKKVEAKKQINRAIMGFGKDPLIMEIRAIVSKRRRVSRKKKIPIGV